MDSISNDEEENSWSLSWKTIVIGIIGVTVVGLAALHHQGALFPDASSSPTSSTTKTNSANRDSPEQDNTNSSKEKTENVTRSYEPKSNAKKEEIKRFTKELSSKEKQTKSSKNYHVKRVEGKLQAWTHQNIPLKPSSPCSSDTGIIDNTSSALNESKDGEREKEKSKDLTQEEEKDIQRKKPEAEAAPHWSNDPPGPTTSKIMRLWLEKARLELEKKSQKDFLEDLRVPKQGSSKVVKRKGGHHHKHRTHSSRHHEKRPQKHHKSKKHKNLKKKTHAKTDNKKK